MTMQLDDNDKQTLLQLARQSIEDSLNNSWQQVLASDYDSKLQVEAACFVTLTIKGNLRGCIGHLSAMQPLVLDVYENARSAAFNDPRFAPLTTSELKQVDIEISVLTPAQAMSFVDEADLLQQIRPGVDGLILEDMGRRGTFLPSVWEQLPDRQQFWQHLKLKASLPLNHWSDSVKVWRYESLAFAER